MWLTAGAAVVRMVLSQQELLELVTLRREALTDDLTCIANRRPLLADLPSRVAELLRRHGVEPGSLGLQITETVLMSRSPRTRSVLDGLRRLGVESSVDDFGTGYSSLANLEEFLVAEGELDRGFVADIALDPRSAVATSTIWLGHQLGVRIVGEGVENPTPSSCCRSRVATRRRVSCTPGP